MRWPSSRHFCLAVLAWTHAAGRVAAQELSDSQVSQIRSRLAEVALKSWELGTRAQVLLELDAPAFSVFSPNPLPPPHEIPSNLTGLISSVMSIARNVVGGRAASNKNATGPQPLMQDGSAADPASIGIAVLLANWTGQGGQDYAGAAKDQLDFLMQRVPRTDDGAISHRVSEVQLWNDYMYMVPPFLAYYGVLTRDKSLVTEAYNQCKLYRNYLRDTHANNLWQHILLGSFNDTGHWSTGNAWAASGLLRVLATIQHSEYDNQFKHEKSDLASWTTEIHEAMYSRMDNSNVFPNYASRAVNDPGNFYDAASTALLASTVYRLSLLWGTHRHLPFAERSRKTLFTNSSNHLTSEGWLQPVVNPHSFGEQGQHSPEGQAFVLALHASYSDWVKDGAKGANAAVRLSVVGMPWLWACLLVGIVFAF
ncbi:hypothetical protein HGRIS_010674 [Hohenbuehelia grisea]|uniref:Uncharacterized protein n=1 Tax=Hohenbuehelia grisea TaxID=104357 RepID=A0ABR3IXE1_9AGAR